MNRLARSRVVPPLILLLGVLAEPGCTSPCDNLRDRAQRCNTVRSTYVDPDLSVCSNLQNQLNGQFEDFAQCVYRAPCQRDNAIGTCLEEHAAEATTCQRFSLWAAACGLEPQGTENDCAALASTIVPGSRGGSDANALFSEWVDCVIADECPVRGDTRYDRCQQEVVPQGPAGLLAACIRVAEWGEQCTGQEVDLGLPLLSDNLFTCLSQAQQFTTQSYIAYANCVADVACDDLAGRIFCIDHLRFVDTSAAVAACQELENYADACGVDALPGGTRESCVQVLMRATPSSVNAYADCVTTIACSEAATNILCLGLLEFET